MSLIKKFKMKKMLALTLAAFMSFTTVTAMPIQQVNAVEEPASLERQLIPLPVDYEVTQDKFTISEDTNIYVKGLDDEQTDELYENVGEYLASKLRASTGYELPVVKDNESINNSIVIKTVDDEAQGEEGYKIKTTEAGVEITANQPAGAFMAVQTVRQLLPADIEKTELVEGVSWVIPCSSINDKPEYEYRGSHLDVTRHFFSVEDVKRYIDNMAQYKMNKLHLHLSDDQGWRLEIKGEMYGESLSKLNTIGAQTSTSINGIKAGQYTQEDYKELVAYAADRYVEIIPEFDMPGHSWAAFEKELNEANVVYNDDNAMQEEVNNAYKELVTAFLNLRLIPDKSLLEDLINQAEGLNSVNYTKATFNGLTKALDEAKVVFDDPNATQEQVNNAKDLLEKAIAGLQANPSTPSNVDNTVSTPLDNGDTTASVKTGDGSLVGMFATIALLSVAGYTVLRRKEN